MFRFCRYIGISIGVRSSDIDVDMCTDVSTSFGAVVTISAEVDVGISICWC